MKCASSVSSRTPKSIASAFEPHMGVFVDAQDKFVFLGPNFSLPFRIGLLYTMSTGHCPICSPPIDPQERLWRKRDPDPPSIPPHERQKILQTSRPIPQFPFCLLLLSSSTFMARTWTSVLNYRLGSLYLIFARSIRNGWRYMLVWAPCFSLYMAADWSLQRMCLSSRLQNGANSLRFIT